MFKKDEPKKAYRLWREYLKISDGYRNFCHKFRKRPFDNNEFCRVTRRPSLASLTGSQISIEERISLDHHFRNYALFGDVYRNSFEKWWKNDFPKIQIKNVVDITDGVENLWRGLFLKGEVDKFLPSAKTELEAECQVTSELLRPHYGCVLRIDGLDYWDKDDLLKAVREEISKIEDKRSRLPYAARNFGANNIAKGAEKNWIHKYGPLPFLGPRVFGQLKRYLKIYKQVLRLKNQRGIWEKVFDSFYPQIAKNLLDIERKEKQTRSLLSETELGQKAHLTDKKISRIRALKRDYAHAKKIIANVENGEFPGEYQ